MGGDNYFCCSIHIGSNWCTAKGVRDLKIAFLKVILLYLMTYIYINNLSNRPVYAVLSTHNLDLIRQQKYMLIVINPANESL